MEKININYFNLLNFVVVNFKFKLNELIKKLMSFDDDVYDIDISQENSFLDDNTCEIITPSEMKNI